MRVREVLEALEATWSDFAIEGTIRSTVLGVLRDIRASLPPSEAINAGEVEAVARGEQLSREQFEEKLRFNDLGYTSAIAIIRSLFTQVDTLHARVTELDRDLAKLEGGFSRAVEHGRRTAERAQKLGDRADAAEARCDALRKALEHAGDFIKEWDSGSTVTEHGWFHDELLAEWLLIRAALQPIPTAAGEG